MASQCYVPALNGETMGYSERVNAILYQSSCDECKDFDWKSLACIIWVSLESSHKCPYREKQGHFEPGGRDWNVVATI